MKIRTKLALFASLLIVVVVGSVSVVFFLSEQTRIPGELRRQALTLTRGFAQVCRESVLSHDDILPINYIKLFLKGREDILQAMYVTTEGKIVAHTDPALISEAWHESDNNPLLGLRGEETRLIAFKGVHGLEWCESVGLPVDPTGGGVPVGVARIDFSKAHWDRAIAEQLALTRNRIASVAVPVFLVGVVGALVLALFIARPIHQLVEGAKAIGSGNLAYRINVTSRDELGKLAQEFNEMGRKLEELDEMKSSFVSSVSHELRSPLTAIKGYVEQMLKGRAGPLTESQGEFLTIVKNNTARLSGFIDDILDLAKIEAKQLDLRPEPVSLGSIAEEIVTLFKFQAEEKSIVLTSTLTPSLPRVRADQDKLRQVFTNLVSNALKFTPEKGRITVSASQKNGEIECVVADSGLGIPPEDQPFIFDKFRQSQSVQSRAKKVKGTGLGLAIVKGIVEGHGGRIWLTSVVDRGTTITFSVPIAVPGPSLREGMLA